MYKKLLFLLLTCFFARATGIVLFLRGTGSVGKTSLCREFLKKNPSWKLIEEDELYFNKFVCFLKDIFPQELCSIEKAIPPENIFHAVQRNQVLFKEDATAQQKLDASLALYGIRKQLDHLIVSNQEINNLKSSLIDYAEPYIKQGCNIIVDSAGFIKPEDFEKKGYKAIQILVYCSFKNFVNRTIQRNTEALLHRNLLSMRYYHHLLLSFSDIYEFKEKSDQALDIITQEEVNNVLDVIDLALPALENINGFTRAELGRKQLHEYRANFMKKFIHKDTLYITHKIKADFCIKTDKHTTADALQQLLDIVESLAI